MSEPGKLEKLPAGCKEMGTATGDFTTISPLRSPPRLSNAACPGNIPPLGAEMTVVNPAERQVSPRLSLRLVSPGAARPGVAPGRSSGPREMGGCRCDPRSPEGVGVGG